MDSVQRILNDPAKLRFDYSTERLIYVKIDYDETEDFCHVIFYDL
jgi:hypothetical protein